MQTDNYTNSDFERENHETNVTRIGIILISLVILTVVVYGSVMFYLNWPVEDLSIDHAGLFGDSFNVLTALFSGLAFSGVIITILLQREELRRQREELQLQRMELKEQRKQFERSADAQEGKNVFDSFLVKRNVSMDLLKEWHSVEMQTVRQQFDDDMFNARDPAIAFQAVNRPREIWEVNMRRLVQFFEKWGFLADHGELDNELLLAATRTYLGTYWRSLVRPLIVGNVLERDREDVMRRYPFVEFSDP